jgi:hypothetical protein
MRKFWKDTELADLKKKIDLKVTAKTNAYHIYKELEKENKTSLDFDQIYHGVLKAIKELKEYKTLKESQPFKIHPPQHIGLLDIYGKIQHNPARWYGVTELNEYMSYNDRLAFANSKEGQTQILGSILATGDFPYKRSGYGRYYFIDANKFRDYLVSLGILHITSKELEEIDKPQIYTKESVKTNNKKKTDLKLYEIEEVPIAIIKNKFVTMKFKNPQDFISSLIGRTQKVYYSNVFCIYFDSAKSHLYEFYDNTDKKYILDSITKINENKLEETK